MRAGNFMEFAVIILYYLLMPSQPRFSALIFDFDGVLVDSESLQARVWQLVAREVGRPVPSLTAADIAGRLDSEIARDLFGDSIDVAACVARKVAIQDRLEAAGELQTVPGAMDFIRWALEEGYTLAVCSNSEESRVRRWLAEHDLDSCFRAVVGYLPGRRPKPAPELYLLTLAALEGAAHRAAAIEDSAPGIKAARAAGVFTIQLLSSDIPALPEAGWQVSSFVELRNRLTHSL